MRIACELELAPGKIPSSRPRWFGTWTVCALDWHWRLSLLIDVSVSVCLSHLLLRISPALSLPRAIPKCCHRPLVEMEHLHRIDIRDGKVTGEGVFVDAISHFSEHLPNMTFYINRLDEPRVLKRPPTTPLLAHVHYDVKRKLYRKDAAHSILPLMEQVCSLPASKLRSHGFFLNPCSFEATAELVPIFSSASVGACFADILYPSDYYLKTPETEEWAEPVPVSARVVSSWPHKKNKVFWRGTSTGGGASADGPPYMEYHRQRLLSRYGSNAKPNDTLYDLAFTRILQCDEKACAEQHRRFDPMAGWTPLADSRDIKYLIDIDGNTFSQRFMPFLRFTGSLIFKLFLFEDWLTEQTRPNEHYLPVSLDLHDLDAKIRWAQNHDDKARRIAMAAQLHASKRLRYDDMLCYFYRLLLEYHELTMPGLVDREEQDHLGDE